MGLDPKTLPDALLSKVSPADRQAAGLPTLQSDVTQEDPSTYSWAEGLIGSPPCPPFSRGGNIIGADTGTSKVV